MNGEKSIRSYMQSRPNPIIGIKEYVEAYIAANGRSILENNREKLRKAYEEAGDMAYGTFLNLLFLDVHKQLRQEGLQPEPRLPGDFDSSREWGSCPEQTDQQRWMWSTIKEEGGEAVGTLVTIVYHDHTGFRVPRMPDLLALEESGKEKVVEALSSRSEDFRNALEFTEEYARYLQSQSEGQA
ncbi:DUF6022 family protein [Paenibacillus aurantius]|uniref:DUF6022 family protein n=1 Tax=Paenibacillus aurantius TaxID=2918900 RepID=A0AA96REY4_9BACL|nr:DUF6022 family protein [Paenibacillus aurantius]WNQ10916.1 DUF6022 family protein [Paenibacillus aurantius]